jgi:hypothetical protein
LRTSHVAVALAGNILTSTFIATLAAFTAALASTFATFSAAITARCAL